MSQDVRSRATLREKTLALTTTARVVIADFCRRRHFLPRRALQLRLLANVIVSLAVFSMLLIMALFLPLMHIVRGAVPDAPDTVEAARRLLFLNSRFWPALGLAVVVVTLLSIRSSHRIAGPLYRFSVIFDAVKSGKIPMPFRIRKGDLLTEDAARINAMLDTLRERERVVEQAAFELHEIAATLDRQEVARDEVARSLRNIESRLDRRGES